AQGRQQRAQHGFQITALPAQRRTQRHQRQQSQKDRRENQGVIRRTDGNLGAAGRIQHQRIDGADKDGGTGGHQKDIVQQQGGLAADGGKGRAALQAGRPPSKQRQCAADGQRDQDHNEEAAGGIASEGMHRGDDAGPHQKSADQGHGKSTDRQQQG